MILQAISVSIIVALTAVVGVFVFGHDRRLVGIERFVVPVAVGVFLSLIFIELIPETLHQSPEWGGIMVVAGFIFFYILSDYLHKKFHHLEEEDCGRRGSALLLLTGDSVHNFADGIVLGGAFLIDPMVGAAVALGMVIHELLQEVVEFGVLLRAGYTRIQALTLNLVSASTIILGTTLVVVLSAHVEEYVWMLIGFTAGNLLFLAASDLLPRIHGNLSHYGSVWRSVTSIILGFIIMTLLLFWSHNHFESGIDDPSHFENEISVQ